MFFQVTTVYACEGRIVKKVTCIQSALIFNVVHMRLAFHQVAEYSEISEEVQKKRDPDGKLMFREANIANHFFTVDFLEKIVK